MAEIRDDDLFTQPDISHYGECPICCLPLSIDVSKSIMMSCCSQYICLGCQYANGKREFEAGLKQRCAFCREPAPFTVEENEKRVMERVKKNDPVAMTHMGIRRYHEGDYETAFEYLKKAAELGEANAHYNLSCMYHNGRGVEKDTEKEVYHLEQAAIAGHPNARDNLGCIEADSGRFGRARKHFIIAANLGYNDSLKGVRRLYAEGHASKEDYSDALRAYQATVETTKSPEREKAQEAIKRGEVEILGPSNSSLIAG